MRDVDELKAEIARLKKQIENLRQTCRRVMRECHRRGIHLSSYVHDRLLVHASYQHGPFDPAAPVGPAVRRGRSVHQPDRP